MKFIVSRTSIWDDEKPPCEEARRDSIVRVETRTLYTPEEFDKRFALQEGKWLSVGTNHRINERGYITRDNGTIDVWSLELNNLEELVEFVNKYGEIVIGNDWRNKDYKSIEIYDDYRE